MVWTGVIAHFMGDPTRLIDCEGAFRAGKTTAALWKVFTSTQDHPGIHWLICRYSDGDTKSVLLPQWRAVLRTAGVTPTWDPVAHCDELPNGSRVYILGLKAQDQVSRYAKLRGRTLAGVYVDQAEELPADVYQELVGRLSQSGYPHQLLLTPNPPDEGHWLAREFPEDNRIAGRHYYSVPVYANAHNLPPEAIAGLEAAYPPAHPKHRSAVLGLRGLNVVGEPVYGHAFRRDLHVRPLVPDPQLPLLESIDYGKHHPCVVWAQYTPLGALHVLGGILGQDLYLEDFAPLVLQYRQQWFPRTAGVMTCCDPAGSHDNSQGIRLNGVQVLKTHGLHPRWRDNSNAPDVRLAMVERLAALMRKRTAGGEAFGVAADARWLRIAPSRVVPHAFVADALEAGYVWDEHMVSVGSKQVRRPKKDGWFEHGMNCLEYVELNFGGVQPTLEQVARRATAQERLALRRSQQDRDSWRWQPVRVGRGGY
jgi:hypothetical protein